MVRAGLIAVIVGLGVCMFHFWGNAYAGLDVREASRSLFVWLTRRWRDSALSFGGTNYSHGWAIPLVSAWLVWRRRKEWARIPRHTSLAGLAVVVLGLLAHWMGAKAELPQLSALALIALLWGTSWFLMGTPAAKLLFFPCVYLLFCVPWNFFDNLTFPLRLLASTISTGLLNGLNVPAQRVGTAIFSSAGGGFNFDVADPCSGIRSLLAMMAVVAVYAYVTQATLARKWLLFLASVPVALIGNVARIVGVALMAVWFGTDVALGAYHNYSGYIVYVVAVLLILETARWIEKLGGRKHATAAEAPSPARAEAAPVVGARAWAPYGVVIGLLMLGMLALARMPEVRVSDRTALSTQLPEEVGEWMGTEQRFCQNPQCLKAFTLTNLHDSEVCPACAGLLEPISLAEKQLLPSDTVLVKRCYVDSAGAAVYVTIVFSGSERSSIHRPEICVVGQGHTIVNASDFTVNIGGGPPLRVRGLDLELKQVLPGGETHAFRSCFDYWFVGNNRETPSHLQRLFWMSYDRVLRNVATRWAYVSVSTSTAGSPESGHERVKRFIAAWYPRVRVADSPATMPAPPPAPQ